MQNRTIQSRTKQGLTVVQLWKSKYSSLQLREFDFNDAGKKELCNPIFFTSSHLRTSNCSASF